MSVLTDKVPPVPQLVPPLVALQPVDIDLKTLRFDNSWMQWFTQVKFKIDSINLNVVSISELTGQGVLFRNNLTGFSTGEIEGTSGRISVADGDGVAGNPTIDFVDAGVDARVNAGIATHVAQPDPHAQYVMDTDSPSFPSISTTVYTVGTLPTGSQGMRAFVSDATTQIFGGTVTGGGATPTPVYHDGTVWRCG